MPTSRRDPTEEEGSNMNSKFQGTHLVRQNEETKATGQLPDGNV